MPASRTRHQDDTRLRFVFDNRVISLDLATDLTYWEVAETLHDLRKRYGDPIAIDIVKGSRPEVSSASPWRRFRPTMA